MSEPAVARIEQLLSALREKPIEHGRRVSYMLGCRCLPCRAANARHASRRLARRAAGNDGALVDAADAREHMRRLSEQGIGRHSVCKASGVSDSILWLVVSGERRNIRRTTEKRILAVDENALADGARIDARPTWRILNALIANGYTRRQLAVWLGSKATTNPALQIRKSYVTVKTARAVETLAARIDRGEMQRDV